MVALLRGQRCCCSSQSALLAAKLDPFSSESEDEAGLHRPGGVRTQRARSDADKALAHNRLDAQKGGGKDFEPSDSLAEDSEIPFDPAGHLATRQSVTQKRPPKPVYPTISLSGICRTCMCSHHPCWELVGV